MCWDRASCLSSFELPSHVAMLWHDMACYGYDGVHLNPTNPGHERGHSRAPLGLTGCTIPSVTGQPTTWGLLKGMIRWKTPTNPHKKTGSSNIFNRISGTISSIHHVSRACRTYPEETVTPGWAVPALHPSPRQVLPT